MHDDRNESAGAQSPEEAAIEHITHVLMHALSEEEIAGELDQATSQREAYDVLCQLDYFKLSFEEFQLGISVLREG